MSGDLRRAIIGCLRVAGPVEAHLRRLREFPARHWEASLDWLNISGIALAFWDRLRQSGAQGSVPREVSTVLAANLGNQCRRVAVMRQEFDSLNRQFEHAGIEYAAWKGFALIPDYCPDACWRPTYDYDYLISGNDWDRAEEALYAAGYVRKIDDGTKNRINFARPKPALPAPSRLYAVTLPRKVELHSSLWDEEACGLSLRVPGRPLDRRVRRTWQGLSFYALGEEDAFIFQTLHVFQHILHNWCRLGWLLELAYFLERRAADSFFWKKLLARLERNPALSEIVALVISLASHLFQSALPAAMEKELLSAMRGEVALWVEHYGLASALDNFSENKNSLFLYREFVRDEASWRRIRKSRLFPLHRPNRVTGAATPGASASVQGSWRQASYLVHRVIHHAVTGIHYAWESARWDRMRRQSAHRVLP